LKRWKGQSQVVVDGKDGPGLSGKRGSMNSYKSVCLTILLSVLFVFPAVIIAAQDNIPDVAAPSAPTMDTADTAVPPNTNDTSIESMVVAEGVSLTYRLNFPQRLLVAALIVVLMIIFVKFLWYLFDRFKIKLTEYGEKHFKSLTVKKYRILDTKQILGLFFSLLKIVKYIITVFMFFITIPIVFSLFSRTQNLASVLFGYILTPLKNIGLGIIHYIPNLFTIAIILIINKYVIQTIKFLASRIERGKLVIHGFYPDWAAPTYNILRFLLYAFTVAIIYPYLPGSDSKIFQGVSVFVGIIISLGSSSAIGNLVAGLVITYMRPFKIGDRIQIKDNTGFVVEKTLMIVRIKTHKNEYITFPNMMILGSNIINYNKSSDENEEGLILYADITFGYSTPWQTIHEILIEAGLKTTHVLKSPKPFVLQTSLDDFYAHYQINVYTKEVDLVPAIYSELFMNIQNGFRNSGLDMTAAHFRINLSAEARRPPFSNRQATSKIAAKEE
jgi:small-conductance mechanosensitive channel